MNQQRGFANALEFGALHWIQVEMEIIRTIHVVTTRIPWIQINAAQIDDPQQRGQVAYDREINDAARGVFDGTDLDPVRPWHRRALLKKEIASGAIRISLHDHGAID